MVNSLLRQYRKLRTRVNRNHCISKIWGNKKIFDCFMLFEEIELLQLRLMEYYEYVDYFVVVESKKTFKGNEHELIFEKNKILFEKYLDKIIYLVVSDLPKNDEEHIWNAEVYQRNYIDNALRDYAKIGDVIILSDIDEFWNIKHINRIRRCSSPFVFEQDLYYYYFNCKKNEKWLGTCCAPYGIFSPQEMRDYARFGKDHKIVKNGGWHYSYLGGAERIQSKLDNLSDSHLVKAKVGTEEDIERKILNGIELWDANISYTFIDLRKFDNPASLDILIKMYPKLIRQ